MAGSERPGCPVRCDWEWGEGANRFAGGGAGALNGADETTFLERKRSARGAWQRTARLDGGFAGRCDFPARGEGARADVEHIVWPAGYERAWNAAEKKGYSGTALFSRTKPLSVVRGIGSAAHDAEGRAITAEFPDCYVVGVYVPNAQPELARIGFRQEWDRALLGYLKNWKRKNRCCCAAI